MNDLLQLIGEDTESFSDKDMSCKVVHMLLKGRSRIKYFDKDGTLQTHFEGNRHRERSQQRTKGLWHTFQLDQSDDNEDDSVESSCKSMSMNEFMELDWKLAHSQVQSLREQVPPYHNHLW
jgi:hypothetical protein